MAGGGGGSFCAPISIVTPLPLLRRFIPLTLRADRLSASGDEQRHESSISQQRSTFVGRFFLPFFTPYRVERFFSNHC